MGFACSKPKKETVTIGSDITELFTQPGKVFDETNSPDRIKMVLLGAGNAGKTTVLKQFRMKYGNGFSQDERYATKQIILRSYVTAMQKLLYAVTDILSSDQLDATHVAIKDFQHGNKALVGRFKNLGDTSTVMHQFTIGRSKDYESHSNTDQHASDNRPTVIRVKDAIIRLWADPLVQRAYYHNSLITSLEEPMDYIMEHIERITSSGYMPNDEDFLYVREATEKAVYFDFDFPIKGGMMSRKGSKMSCRVVDLGGQRDHRRNWPVELIDDVLVVFFVVGLDGFDQVLVEDGKTNKMTESLELFRDICQNPSLASANFMLIFNKLDLFKLKWQRIQRMYNVQQQRFEQQLQQQQQEQTQEPNDHKHSKSSSKAASTSKSHQHVRAPTGFSEFITPFFSTSSKITGRDSHLTACDYVVKKFTQVHSQEVANHAKGGRPKERINFNRSRVYPFVTCATDIETMGKFVVDSMRTIVTFQNLGNQFD